MRHPRIKRVCLGCSAVIAIVFVVLWVRSYWFDMFLCYEAGATSSKGGHTFWTATQPGAFNIAIRWEEYNPKTMHDHGLWRFDDNRRSSPFCGVVGGVEKSFLGFQHWIAESPDSYRYNYTWIPFWFPALLFASPALWYLIRTKLAPNKSFWRSATI